MRHLFFDIAKIFTVVILSFNFFVTKAYSSVTTLTVDKDTIVNTSGNSISFESVASNSKNYRVKLTCFNQEPNYKEGSFSVLKSEYHVGASLAFSYNECLEIRRSLLNGSEKIFLSWDQEKFDDFISAKLSFQREVDNN